MKFKGLDKQVDYITKSSIVMVFKNIYINVSEVAYNIFKIILVAH